jgi:hypothetical protein
MSALAPARPARAAGTARPADRARPTRATPPSRPALRLVAGAPAVAARVPFTVLIAAILGAGLLSLLMLHTLAAQDAFTVHDLEHRAAALADSEQQLELADQQASAPSLLAARARALGMVPTGSLKFVHRGGRVVGVATAASPPRPAPAKPAPSAAASPSAQAQQQAAGQKQRAGPKHPGAQKRSASPAPHATTGH